jgi:hypothetical protein
MSKQEAQESKLKTIKDVVFYYTSTTYATKQLNKDNKPPLSDDPLEFHSYEVKIAIPESRFKQLKKKFSGAKNFPNVKEYSPSEFVEKGFAEEEPDEDMVLIKFAQAALTGKKGARKPSRPITQIGIKGKVQDRNGVTISADTQIGNGTKGHLQFNPVESDYGLYLYPTAICITELVEYQSGAGGYDEDGFDLEELDEVGEEADEASDDDFDDDIPF